MNRFDVLEFSNAPVAAPAAPVPPTPVTTAPVSFPTTGKVVADAHKQWAKRPADERFASVSDLLAYLTDRRSKTKEVERPFSTLRVEAAGTDVRLATERGSAGLTHHSFGQLASLAGLQASGLRASFTAFKETEAAAKWVADGLNLGLQGREGGNPTANLLLTANQGKLTARSVNTGEYSRVWDLDLVQRLLVPLQEFGFVNPPAYDGPGGLYAGDKDMFALMVPRNTARINMRGVTCDICPEPIEVNGQLFYPFLMMQGSEVGGTSQKFSTGLLQAVCANLNMYGVEGMEELTVRHVGNPWTRINEAYRGFLNRWVKADQRKQSALIARAMNKTLASTLQEAQEIAIRKTGLSQKAIQQATDLIMKGDKSTGIVSDDPTILWNYVAAITAQARLRLNLDDQVEQAKAAGKLMLMVR